MTHRERLERKKELREEWAGKAAARAASRFDAAGRIADGIPLGQPILVGHHSEKRARRDAARIHANMDKGCEEQDLAAHHRGACAGIARQLEESVFSDDTDAVVQLEARIAEREREAETFARINRAWRKGGRDAVAEVAGEKVADTAARTLALCPWLGVPLDTTNLRASIRRDRKRIEEVKARQARDGRAEATPGGVLVETAGDPTLHGDKYVRLTFAEKPARTVLDALKAAGFRWGAGCWIGERAKLQGYDATRALLEGL